MKQGIVSAPHDSSPDLLYTGRVSNRSVDQLLLSQTSGASRHETFHEFTALNDSEATQTSHSDSIQANTVSILLTGPTLMLMAKTMMENKKCHNYEVEYEEMKTKAAVGEAFIEDQQSKVDDINLAEDFREQARQDIQDARPRVLEDIKRCDEMERELNSRKANLNYTRGHLDNMMEQMMNDVGVFERLASENHDDERRTNYEELSEECEHREEVSQSDSILHEARNSEATVSATNSSVLEARVEARVRLEAAADRAIRAQDQFDQRHEAYLEDIRDYGHDHSRTEIDHYWFRKGAELAREFIDAEAEYDQARAQAMALDLLGNSADQEFDFADEDDGYRESEDPICDVDEVDRPFIEAWSAKVQEEQENQDPVAPATEWDAESVNISESVSAIEGRAGWRKAIDKWHSQQETLRAQFAVLSENEQ